MWIMPSYICCMSSRQSHPYRRDVRGTMIGEAYISDSEISQWSAATFTHRRRLADNPPGPHYGAEPTAFTRAPVFSEAACRALSSPLPPCVQYHGADACHRRHYPSWAGE